MASQQARKESGESSRRAAELPVRTELERVSEERSTGGDKDVESGGKGENNSLELDASKEKGKQKAARPETPPNGEEDARDALLQVLEEFSRSVDNNIEVTNGAIEMATEAMKRATEARESTHQLRERWAGLRDKLQSYKGIVNLDDEVMTRPVRDVLEKPKVNAPDPEEIWVSTLRLGEAPRFQYRGLTYTLDQMVEPRGQWESAESHAYREEVVKNYYEWKRTAKEKLLATYEGLRTEQEADEENLTLSEIEKMLVKQPAATSDHDARRQRDLERGAIVFGSIDAAARVWEDSLKRGEREAFKGTLNDGRSRRTDQIGGGQRRERTQDREVTGEREHGPNNGFWWEQIPGSGGRRNGDNHQDNGDDRRDRRRDGDERRQAAGGAPDGDDPDDSSHGDDGSFHGRRMGIPPMNAQGRADNPDRREITPDYQPSGRDSAAVTKLRQLVREGLAEELPELPKGFKVPAQTKYDGTDKPEKFGIFASDMMTWLQLSRLVDSKYRAAQIMSLGTALEGEASEWYKQEIKDPDRAKRTWTLEEAMVALYGRFIHKASIQEAFINFRKTRYDPNRGFPLTNTSMRMRDWTPKARTYRR
ncbi:hypothetical protein FA95DRAFT_1577694 [Auriscalpium vulgare]|uniref:Uncharacterized protein n=1 Tax=Auriscalpium vulgare TaxID=40419 RepID=A0ACB8R5V7_9AGAM|nr:hypothetical protein FA95DRAFT_1577694 [Auriscalpium vulgare]